MSPTAFNSECTSPPANCHLRKKRIFVKIWFFFSFSTELSDFTNNKFALVGTAATEIHSALALYIDSCQYSPQITHVSLYPQDVADAVVKSISKLRAIDVALDLIHCICPANCIRVRFSPKHFSYSPGWVFFAWIELNSMMAIKVYRTRAQWLLFQGSKYRPKYCLWSRAFVQATYIECFCKGEIVLLAEHFGAVIFQGEAHEPNGKCNQITTIRLMKHAIIEQLNIAELVNQHIFWLQRLHCKIEFLNVL